MNSKKGQFVERSHWQGPLPYNRFLHWLERIIIHDPSTLLTDMTPSIVTPRLVALRQDHVGITTYSPGYLVILIYKPVFHYTTDHKSNKPDTVNHVPANSELQYDDEKKHVPVVSVVSTNCPPVLSYVCKSDTIMSDLTY